MAIIPAIFVTVFALFGAKYVVERFILGKKMINVRTPNLGLKQNKELEDKMNYMMNEDVDMDKVVLLLEPEQKDKLEKGEYQLGFSNIKVYNLTKGYYEKNVELLIPTFHSSGLNDEVLMSKDTGEEMQEIVRAKLDGVKLTYN